MLRQLNKQDMQEVTGGLGIVEFYIDENGKLVKTSRPAGPGFRDRPRCPVFPFPKFPIRK